MIIEEVIMLTQFNLKKAMSDYYSLVRVIEGKSFGASRKAVAASASGVVDYTSVKDRCFYFKYKSLKGTIYQDETGKMRINDFLYVLDGFNEKYVPFYGVDHLNLEMLIAS